MKKLILAIGLLLLACNQAYAATTYYVRVNGGTSSQCTGLSNADYSGTGTAQACAFSHPAWNMGSSTTAKWIGGDTMIVDDNGGTAQYMIGFGMPNTSGVTASNEFAAVLNQIPSGPDAAHPTRILGSSYATGCATRPQFWGTQSIYTILDMTNKSNIEVQCLEITDHSTCGFQNGGNKCSESYGASVGTYGRNGIEIRGGAANLLLRNVNIHGMASNGIKGGGINGMVLDHVDLTGNHIDNWDGDVTTQFGVSSTMSGNIIMNYFRTRFSSCREAYPVTTFTVNDYNDCTVKSNGGYGDGVGFYNTSGHWIITNSEFSHNSSDGLDLLYGINTLDLDIDKTLFEGNAGNQVKFTARNLNFTNSVIIANCDYFHVTGKEYDTASFETCRANGTPISSVVGGGGTWKITNVTAYTSTGGAGSPFIEATNGGGYCTGTETYTYKNLMLKSNHSPTNWTPFYNTNLPGACATAWNNTSVTYSLVYDFNSNPSGTGNVYTAPPWVGSISSSASTNFPNVYLTSNVGGGNASTYWNDSKDINKFPQNASIDRGGIQYGSTIQQIQPGQACIATSDCASGTCSNFVCSGGSGTANGGACVTGATCTSGYCNGSLVCANPPTCGDGLIQAGEICDTSGPNLNGSTCIQQGFTGGTLGCTTGCGSFNTSSCTNTTVFPLTPILDSFTRSNSTGLNSTNWVTLVGSFNISSNAALPVNGSSSSNLSYWAAAGFSADEESYVTISNKGSNADEATVYVRYNPTTHVGYKIEAVPSLSRIYIQRVDPAETQLGATVTQALATGDSIGMSIVGSTITLYYKASGGSWVALTTRTDTTYTAGDHVALSSPSGSGATPDIKFTNFGGGSINPIVCGNGLKEGAEICDLSDLASQSCTTQGFASGTLTCNPNCTAFVTTSCVAASVCGNNTKEAGEICDGTDVNLQTCALQGFGSGTLACSTDCLSYVTTGCVASVNSSLRGITFK